uniref:RRM domain-containing protein n=1 Tax=Mesocestoides corti TaxID=53468 RepID=A0A5K3F9R3_MESCO
MTSVNVQPSDFTTRYVDPEGVPIPNAGQALLGGSSNAPKFGTLIPNRIFVGGIPSNTTEQELKTYFSSFGQVKDVKIINDRLGVSKGSYGFVTFESQEVAEKIIKNESETLIFKDRKLNIGHAIRKQQLFPRPADVPPALFFAGGAIPCGFQSGLPVFPLTGQDYSGLLAQPGSAYQQMLLQQANGAVYLSPQANHAAAAAQYSAALQSHLAAAAAAAAAQPNAATAAAFATLQHHQQYQQASLTGPLAAATAGGQTSPAAVMAAAAAAVAAASQWSNATNTTANGHQSSPALPAPPQLTPTPSVSVSQHSSAALGGVLDAQSPQVAALAAAVAAQQQLAAAAWRWPAPQQNGGAVMPPSASTSTNGSTGQQQQPQQVSTGLYENLSWFYQQPPPPPAPPTSTTESFRLDPAVVASFAAALTANCQASGDTSTDEARPAKRPRLKTDE